MRTDRRMWAAAVAVVAMIAGGAFGEDVASNAAVKPSGTLLVYCAAGVREPVSEIARLFEADTGVKVELTFANTGQLLGQIEMTRTGDVYIPGDVGFAAKAEAKRLTQGKPRAFCSFVPAIYVRKGNPKGIRELSDLARPGIKLALADPSAAVGKILPELCKTNGVDEAALKKNTVTSPAMVTDVALAVKMGTVDAGIIWDAFGNYAPDEAELVRIPVGKNVISVVSAAVLASSGNPAAANAFVDYLASAKGRAILKAKGFSVDKP